MCALEFFKCVRLMRQARQKKKTRHSRDITHTPQYCPAVFFWLSVRPVLFFVRTRMGARRWTTAKVIPKSMKGTSV